MILEHDILETAFEIRAVKTELIALDGGVEQAYRLKLIHLCAENVKSTSQNPETELQLDWKRCPWCSRQVPERIRKIFRQK